MISRLNINQVVLYVCLLSPIFFSILRKIIPGQPSWVELAPSIIVIFIFIYSIKSNIKTPESIRYPLLVIIGIFSFFSILSIFYDARIGVAAILTRIAPILLVFIFYRLISNRLQIINISVFLSWMCVILAPIAIIGFIFGNDYLYMTLSPINSVMEGERHMRYGYGAISTVFTTPWTMSWSFVGVAGILGFSLLSIQDDFFKKKILIHLGLVLSIVLIFLTLRRGALAIGVLCVITTYFYMFNFKRHWLLLTIMLLVVILSVWSVQGQFDDFFLMYNAIISSNDVKLDHRFNLIFWNFFSFWMENHTFGSFLGAAGPEGRAFGFNLSEVHNKAIEVGGAQLVAEIGLIPLAVVIFSILFVFFTQYYNTRKTKIKASIRVLLIMQFGMFFMYFFKEMLVFTNIHMGSYIFWASIGIVMAQTRIYKLSVEFKSEKRFND
jgi:hypothetical protein